MRKRFFGLLAVIALSMAAAAPAMAHHSLQAQFDTNKPIDLSGTLTKVEWINPHSYLWLDVKEADGTVKKWGLELAGQAALRKAGANKILKVGQTYTAHAFLARDGSAMAFLKSISLPDGQTVTFWFGDPNAR
jgi:hypothetical protein